MTFRSVLAMAAMCALAFAVACEEEDKGDKGASNGDCPDGVTYDDVGKPFVEEYCLSCHSEDVDDGLRAGVEEVTFDDLAGIRAHGGHVHERVMDGTMPPKNATKKPDAAARAKFVEWLECSGLAEEEHDH